MQKEDAKTELERVNQKIDRLEDMIARTSDPAVAAPLYSHLTILVSQRQQLLSVLAMNSSSSPADVLEQQKKLLAILGGPAVDPRPSAILFKSEGAGFFGKPAAPDRKVIYAVKAGATGK